VIDSPRRSRAQTAISDTDDAVYKGRVPALENMECVVYGAAAGLVVVGIVGAAVQRCWDSADAADDVIDVAVAYPLATESLTEPGAVDWAGGSVPDVAHRGMALRRELERNWDDIIAIFPVLSDIGSLHGSVVKLSAAEALVARLFGSPRMEQRFAAAHDVLVWTEWDAAFAAAVACHGVDAALDPRSAAAWATVEYAITVGAAAADDSHPLVRIAASRWRFGNSDDTAAPSSSAAL
jgi:hypothetical protein